MRPLPQGLSDTRLTKEARGLFGTLAQNAEAKAGLLCVVSLFDHYCAEKSTQIALVFGTAGIFATAIFYSTSMIIHSLFRYEDTS